MTKYLSLFVTLVTKIAMLTSSFIVRVILQGAIILRVHFAIAIIICLGISDQALAVTQKLQLDTATGYIVETVFSYDDANHPTMIHEQGKGKTKIVESMQVSFYQPSGKLIASYNNIVDGVAQGNFFEFSFEPKTQQLIGNIDLGGEFPGEIYLKGEADRRLSLIEVELSGKENEIDRVENK